MSETDTPTNATSVRARARSRRRSTIAWQVAGMMMLVAALPWSVFQVVSAVARDDYTEVTSYAADDIDHLAVSTANGSVTVTGVGPNGPDGDEIVVTARITDGLRASGNRQEVVGDELRLEASCPSFGSEWCKVDYTVEVPSDLAVRTRTSDGRVDVRGMRSSVDVEVHHGRIELVDVVGDVSLTSQHGSIDATGVEAEELFVRARHGSIDLQLDSSPRRVDAETRHGSIDVAVPDDDAVYVVVDTGTQHGAETIEIRTDPSGDRSIRAVSRHGDVVVRYGG